MIKTDKYLNEVDCEFGKLSQQVSDANSRLRDVEWARSRHLNILSSTLLKIEIMVSSSPEKDWASLIKRFFSELEQELAIVKENLGG